MIALSEDCIDIIFKNHNYFCGLTDHSALTSKKNTCNNLGNVLVVSNGKSKFFKLFMRRVCFSSLLKYFPFFRALWVQDHVQVFWNHKSFGNISQLDSLGQPIRGLVSN